MSECKYYNKKVIPGKMEGVLGYSDLNYKYWCSAQEYSPCNCNGDIEQCTIIKTLLKSDDITIDKMHELIINLLAKNDARKKYLSQDIDYLISRLTSVKKKHL